METPQARRYIEKEEGGNNYIGVPSIQPRYKNEH
jgi:hypothetical protein